MGPRLGLTVVALAATIWLATANANAQSSSPGELTFRLLFDGKPIDAPAGRISYVDDTTNQWLLVEGVLSAGANEYRVKRPPPGHYRVHVAIDANRSNPLEYPGDYEARQHFFVTAETESVDVHLQQLIHVFAPGDIGKPIAGMLTGGCDGMPTFATPKLRWPITAPIELAWMRVLPDAEYHYEIKAIRCGQYEVLGVVAEGRITQLEQRVNVPPSNPNEYYVFELHAEHGGVPVGEIFTHDAGSQAWNYRFRVRDESVPAWAYLLALALTAFACAAGWRWLQDDEDLRLQRGLVLSSVVVIAIVGTAVALRVSRHRAHRAEPALAAATAPTLGATSPGQNFRDAFETAAPKPDWWDTVEPTLKIDDLGTLLSAWTSYSHVGEHEDGDRRFFKAAYLAVLAHPGDTDLVATALELMTSVVPSYPHQIELGELGLERFSDYRRRLDNCMGCKVADTSAHIAQNLARSYITAGQFSGAIVVLERLLAKRENDIADFSRAETRDLLAEAYWRFGDEKKALATLEAAIAQCATSEMSHADCEHFVKGRRNAYLKEQAARAQSHSEAQ